MDYRVIKEGNKLCTYVNIGGRMIKIRGEEKKKKGHKSTSLHTETILLLQ